MYKYICCLFLFAISSLQAYQAPRGERNGQRDDIQIYNENYYPPNYGYGYGYTGYPFIPTPAEAFPDDAEANYLFEKMHE